MTDTAPADLAPLPDPDTADVAAVARWLAVQTLRWREHARLRPEPLPSQRQVQDMNLAFGALHALRTLAFVCGNPEYASLRRAEKAAQDIAVAWRDGDYDDWLAMHCAALGIDTDGVRRLAEAEIAAERAERAAGGRTDAGTGEQTPEAAEAEITALRAQVQHLSDALAGDNEGVRLWMLDCGQLTATHRERSRRAEEKVSILAAKLREADARLGRLEALARSWAAKARPGALPAELDSSDDQPTADCGREILAILGNSAGKEAALGAGAARKGAIIGIAGAADPAACDADRYGDGPASMLDGKCRCMVCGRCGHHTGNSHQGHYWRWCKVTGSMRDFHFCCSDPAYGCELEAPSPDGDGGTQEQAS